MNNEHDIPNCPVCSGELAKPKKGSIKYTCAKCSVEAWFDFQSDGTVHSTFVRRSPPQTEKR